MFSGALNGVSTFLSPPVQRLLVDLREDQLTSLCHEPLVTSDLTFNWDGISTHLLPFLDYSEGDDDQQRYYALCEQVWPIITECGRKVQECKDLSIHFLEWTNCVEDIQLCYSQIQSSKDCIMPLKISLHLSSIFEHSVGNVFKLQEKNVPFLLRDLLSSTELTNIFGKLPMLLAKTLLGTPLAFNLRNICWHGFPAPEEISMDLAATLLVLISSFGELLSSASISSIPCRPKIGKDTWAGYIRAFESMDFPQLKCHQSQVAEMLENSPGVLKTHQAYWTSSLDFLCSESYGECLLLLLPALEHTLRCAFCSVNECPERMLVAEQHTLYTTMDEILDQYCTTPDAVQVENRLPSFLGTKLMDMLMDLFSSFGGPRIRDKLSHGECNLQEIPSIVANHIFCIALLVLHKIECSGKFEFVPCLLKVEQEYSAKFHSISLLRYEADTICETLKHFYIYFKPNLVSSEILDFQSRLSDHMLKLQNFPKCCDFNNLIAFCLNYPIPTLYRDKSDLAHVALLRKILSALHQSCKNCLVTLENRQQYLTQHALRSRQRISYFRMLEFMPSFQVIVECLVSIILVQLVILPEMIVNSKFLKAMQQYADNISSLSCSEKNRWSEMQEKSTCFCRQSIALFHKVSETGPLGGEPNVSLDEKRSKPH